MQPLEVSRPQGSSTRDATIRDEDTTPHFSFDDVGGNEIDDNAKVSFGCFSNVSPKTIVYMSAFLASLTSILLGYDVGVMSGAIKYIQADFGLSTLQEGVIVSSLNLVAAGGGLVAGTLADSLGRKRSIAAACFVFITGSIIKIASNSFGVLLFGRIVTGIGVGCGFVVAPVYIAEITPTSLRGRLTALTDISINVGIVLGYLVAFICAETLDTDSSRWRAMLGISLFPPFVILSSLAILPESPRWLLGKGKARKAFIVLCRIVPSAEDAKVAVESIQQAVSEERGHSSWRDLLCPSNPALLSTVLLGLGLGVAQQASGSEAAVYYSPSVLDDAGLTSDFDQLGGNILVGLFKLGGEVLSYLLVDQVGKRLLFLTSSTMVTFFLVFLAISFSASAAAWVTLTGLCLFMFSFSVGMGALTFVVAAEIFPLLHRGRGVSMVVCVNRLTSGSVALVFPLLERSISAGGTFFLFFLASSVTVWFYYMYLPETAGKSLEEISACTTTGDGMGEHRGEDTAARLGLGPQADPGTVAEL